MKDAALVGPTRTSTTVHEWRTDIENAPKDGSDVLFPIEFVARAYWCKDIGRWVLTYQLRMDYINHPTRWQLPRKEAQRAHPSPSL